MRLGNTFGFTLAALAAAAMVQHASATLIVQDRLTDGVRTDSQGLEAAFLSGGGASASLVDDTGGLNDSNAVGVNAASFDGVAAIFDTDAAGGFDAVSPMIGESLEMRFTFRIVTTPATGVFRYGILNNGSDQQTADNPAGNNDTNTLGFGVEIGIVSGSGRYIMDSNGGAGADAMLGGTGVSAAENLGYTAINDMTTHEGVLRITRGLTGYSLSAELDGNAAATTHFFASALTDFHQLGWISGNGANDFRLDHVELDRNLLQNGTFERGAQITGSPNGDDDGAFNDFKRHWTDTSGIASVHTGLVGESATAAYFTDSISGNFTQSASSDANFQFDVDFATESGSGSDRSFNMLLSSKDNGQINLRVDTAGRINVFDQGVGWQILGGLGTITFSDDVDGDSNFADDVLNVWHLSIIGHNYGTAGANYDIILSSVANPMDIRTVTGLTFWQGVDPIVAARNGVDEIVFTTANGSTFQSSFKTDFAVDNVSLINLAEPIPAPAALPAGLMLMTALATRRRR